MGKGQHDAGEFMEELLLRCVEAGDEQNAETLVRNVIVQTSPQWKSPLGKLMMVPLKSTVRCQLNGSHESSVVSSTWMLPLPIGNGDSVQECLELYLTPETTPTMTKCTSAGCPGTGPTKTLSVVAEPAVLCIQLKRTIFDIEGRGEKNRKLVWLDPQLSVNRSLYDLVGVKAHQGDNPHTGHYYAMMRRPGKREGTYVWEIHNDEGVHPIIDEMVYRNKEAVLMVYERFTDTAKWTGSTEGDIWDLDNILVNCPGNEQPLQQVG